MRLIAFAVVLGIAIPLMLLGVAWVLDPAVPLSVPLAPGFVFQYLARQLGYIASNRMLFWATPLGWSLIAYAALSLSAVGVGALNSGGTGREPLLSCLPGAQVILRCGCYDLACRSARLSAEPLGGGMKRVASSILLFLTIAPVIWAGPKPIRVTGPTVIAFFPAVPQDEIEEDMDTNDALDDFQWYVRQARQPLAESGIQLHEVYGSRLLLRIRGKTRTFVPDEPKVGYYFVTPGKKPLVSYGVDTDEDLFDTAREYFGIRVSREAHQQ